MELVPIGGALGRRPPFEDGGFCDPGVDCGRGLLGGTLELNRGLDWGRGLGGAFEPGRGLGGAFEPGRGLGGAFEPGRGLGGALEP